MPAFEHRGRTYNNPVQLALEVVGGKWKMPILWRLREKTLRYGELRSSLNAHLKTGKVTEKMLAAQLRDLERNGMVLRKAYPEIPPKVEYSITQKGLGAIPAIEALQKLGRALRESG